MVTILVALLVFGVIIAVHEFGHFAVAKLCGIRVNKFAIGMGPVLLKKQGKETEYSLRLLPVGGFCAMEGEDETSDDPRAFSKKSVPQRMAVVVAGACMNLLLGFVVISVMTCLYGDIASTTIAKFPTDEDGNSVSTSESCGLAVGDTILSIDGMRIWTDTDLSYSLQCMTGDPVEVIVKRDSQIITLDSIIFYNTSTAGTADFYICAEELTVFSVLSYSFWDTLSTGRLIWISFLDLIQGQYGISDLSGPVGIVSTIGEAVSYGETMLQHVISVLSLMSFLTINVGIYYLLPIPALDGGLLIFLFIEGIFRKPIPQEKEAMVHFIGLVLLMCIIIAVTFQDICDIIQ